MRIDTLAFGAVEIDDAQLITLSEPLAGFPGVTRFAILNPEPEWPFQWFQSVDRKEVCFLIADPRSFFPGYTAKLRAADLAELKLTQVGEAAVVVILTVPGDAAQTTANLLAPIVINPAAKLARQVILEGSGYPVRAPLLEDEPAVCAAP